MLGPSDVPQAHSQDGGLPTPRLSPSLRPTAAVPGSPRVGRWFTRVQCPPPWRGLAAGCSDRGPVPELLVLRGDSGRCPWGGRLTGGCDAHEHRVSSHLACTRRRLHGHLFFRTCCPRGATLLVIKQHFLWIKCLGGKGTRLLPTPWSTYFHPCRFKAQACTVSHALAPGR